MKVSVIIPGYRHELLNETLQSVFNQTLQPHEVLYDYCKTNRAAEKINRLASISTADAIIVLSDDDMLDPTFIEKTAREMQERGVDIVYTDLLRYGPGDSRSILIASPYTLDHFKASTVPWMTSLIRKSVFDKLGGWDVEQDYQDYDFYFRAFKDGATAFHITEPLFIYRIHQAQDSAHMSHEVARAKMKAKHSEIL